MNAFWASENFNAFIASAPVPSRELNAENSSFWGSEHCSEGHSDQSPKFSDMSRSARDDLGVRVVNAASAKGARSRPSGLVFFSSSTVSAMRMPSPPSPRQTSGNRSAFSLQLSDCRLDIISPPAARLLSSHVIAGSTNTLTSGMLPPNFSTSTTAVCPQLP